MSVAAVYAKKTVAGEKMKNVLFVCVENSCRSQLAEAFGHMLGKDILQVYSSGSRPSGKVNDKAVATMQEIGYDLTTHSSKSLQQIPDINYDYVITMGCGDECPYVRGKIRQDWGIPDPKHLDQHEFAKIRDLIKQKVMDLIQQIRNTERVTD